MITIIITITTITTLTITTIIITIIIIITKGLGKGQMGSARMGSLQIVCLFLAEGVFGVLPLTYFYIPKSARVYFSPKFVKTHYITFAAAPLVLTPFVRNQGAPST